MKLRFCLIFLFVLKVIPAHAGKMADIYKSNKDEIINKQLVLKKGFYFSYGKSKLASSSELSKEFAIEKADLIAHSRFFDYLKDRIRWPERFLPVLIQNVFNQYKKTTGTHFSTSEVVRIDYGQLENDIFFVVLGVPEDKLSGPDITYQTIQKKLDTSFNNNAKSIDLFTYLEICPEGRIAPVVDQLSKQLKDKYGANLDAVISSKPVAELGKLWKKGVTFTQKELQALSRDNLLYILNQKPYDPAVCYFLAKWFSDNGYSRSAKLFYNRGAVWPIYSKYNKWCTEKINEPFSSSPPSFPQILPKKIKKDISRQMVQNKFEFGILGNLIVKGSGRLPISDSKNKQKLYLEATKLFFSESPQIELALEKYIMSLQEGITSDACNMIGRCLQLKRELLLAIPFYMQAITLNPKHPYAGANLVVSLFDAGEIGQAKTLAQTVLKNPKLSNWGRKQIGALEF